MMRRISILGSTGSVGTSTLDLVSRNREAFVVEALTAASNVARLAEQAREVDARVAVVADEDRIPELERALSGSGIEARGGAAALCEAAAGDADWVMAAIVGCAGLRPVMAAVEAGKTVALANKESLVAAGELMMAAARRSGATILPVDSEHNAIFQCLAGQDASAVSRIVLTASGGPFRTKSAAEMARMTPDEAVAHPNWSMGAKISVDSATMMNKGLELIEAHHLFGLPYERIDIVVHPQSVIHSLVEYADGSVLAQLGAPDMRVPIAHALAFPDRMETPCKRLDLASLGRLDFEAPDPERFPALRLAREALEFGGSAPATLNAANEIAVEAFLDGRIGFAQIAETVERVLQKSEARTPGAIDDVLAFDASAREHARNLLSVNA